MIQENTLLTEFNTFGLPIKACFFAQIATLTELKDVLEKHDPALPLLILGGGSNILFTKDFEGLVIKVNFRGIRILEEDEKSIILEAGAGETWHDLVLFAVRNNWAGIENLSLIPGTVGAAPIQNIGAYGVELKDCFESLDAVAIGSGRVHSFTKAECEFGYRSSVFKTHLKNRFVIEKVRLRLRKNPKPNISYTALKTYFEKNNLEHTIQNISEAVIAIRNSKLPDPKKLGNCGSFFKNPEILKSHYQTILQNYPQAVGFESGENLVKMSAGWLIEQCGWKGKIVGNTGAYKEQALVLVNYGQASGQEIYNLAKAIEQSVKEKFEIELQAEVNII